MFWVEKQAQNDQRDSPCSRIVETFVQAFFLPASGISRNRASPTWSAWRFSLVTGKPDVSRRERKLVQPAGWEIIVRNQVTGNLSPEVFCFLLSIPDQK
jgi:hypothetical protein